MKKQQAAHWILTPQLKERNFFDTFARETSYLENKSQVLWLNCKINQQL
ncbi:hypothetical protein [Gloeocapsopsis sp. IPPAS B-1203]|nr:hypothetical protein [Gloeocapsopsis sp. IPPAS B-1203]